MRRMLIDEDQAIRVFHQHVEFVQDTDDLELSIAGRSGCPRRVAIRSGERRCSLLGLVSPRNQ